MINKKMEIQTEGWLQVNDVAKQEIRDMLSEVLFSDIKEISHTAAQVIAIIAAIDVPHEQWPVLIPGLLNNMSNDKCPDLVKKSSVETLGYMCSSLPDSSRLHKSIVDKILTAIVAGISNQNIEICRVSVIALKDALQFARENFELENERNAIMTAICQAATSSDLHLVTAAFECLVEVADFYVTKLKPYIHDIFRISQKAMEGSVNEDVQNLAFEMWNIICTNENSLYIEKEVPFQELLIPSLYMELIPYMKTALINTTTDEGDDISSYKSNDENNNAFNLMLSMSEMLRDDFTKNIIGFSYENINNEDWRNRHAALSVFIATVKGATQAQMGPLVTEIIPILLQKMQKDKETLQVRDVAFKAMCAIFNENYFEMLTEQTCDQLMETVLRCMDEDEELIVVAACETVKEFAKIFVFYAENNTNMLSRYAEQLLKKLTIICGKNSEQEVKHSAYDAQICIVQGCALDCLYLVKLLLEEALKSLDNTLKIQQQYVTHNNNFIDESLNYTQGLVVAILSESIKRLSKEHIQGIEETIAGIIFRILGGGVQTLYSQEEAFMAVGHFAEILESDFHVFEEQYSTLLKAAINTANKVVVIDHPEIAIQAMGSLGDVCKANTNQVHKYCDEILSLLLNLLNSSDVKRKVKPHAIGVFADIVMADYDKVESKELKGCPLEGHIPQIFHMLKAAGHSIMGTEVDPDDEEEIANSLEFRESILGAYSGILVSVVNKDVFNTPYQANDGRQVSEVEFIVSFAANCSDFVTKFPVEDPEPVLEKIILLLGDLANQLGSKNMAQYLRNPHVEFLLNKASENPKVNPDNVQWSRTEIFDK